MENKTYIFYDLETNGLDYYTTSIMQITILDSNGEVLLNQYTYPFNNKIEGTEIHGIDEKKLIENNATTVIDLCTNIKKILRDNYDRKDIYFIAYNNFGYDQVILENNFKISNIKIPNNWYFTDVFPIIKELYKNNIKPNFKLKTVYEHFYGNNNKINFHSSLDDTICLYKIFQKIKNEESTILKYTRGLLQNDNIYTNSISTLGGYSNGMMFELRGIYTIGDLYKIYKNIEYDNKLFDYYLKNNLNIYNNFYINNIIKQLNFIKYIH